MLTRAERLWAWLHTHERQENLPLHDGLVISTVVSFVVPFLVYGFPVDGPGAERHLRHSVAAFLLLAEPELGVGQEWSLAPDERGRPLLGDGGHRDRVLDRRRVGRRHIGTNTTCRTPTDAVVLAANFLSFAIFWVLKSCSSSTRCSRPTNSDEIEEHSRPRSTPRRPDGWQSLGLVSP